MKRKILRTSALFSSIILVGIYFLFEMKGFGRSVQPAGNRIQAQSCLRQIGVVIKLYADGPSGAVAATGGGAVPSTQPTNLNRP